jgi:DNA-binding winged helix-turn-helix (wHTH) protein
MPVKTSDVDLPMVTFGEFRIDFHLRCLNRGTQQVKIGPMAFNVLEFLIKNRHRVVSKDELLKNVWGEERTKGTVEQAVSQLRRVLQDGTEKPQLFIETVPGHGYRFVAQVLVPNPRMSEPDHTPTANGPAPVSPADAVPVAAPPATTARAWASSRPGRITFWLGAVLLLCAATFGVTTRFREQQIASASAVGNTLLAKGSAGNVLWTHRFDYPFMERPEDSKWRIQVVDMYGDGQSEVLVATGLADPTPAFGPEELFCFSSRGKLLWHYRPEIQMEFNTRDLNGPWRITHMIVVDEGRSKSIWLAIDHAIWWPSFIVRIAPDGTRAIKFTSSGAIYGLMSLQTRSGVYVLGGGINNEYRTAAVAVLPVNGAPATSPQADGSEFQCVRGCPAGRPYRYILLPRSEANAASDLPYNDARQLLLRPGGFTIRTSEIEAAAQFFEFTEDFQPERVVYSGDYQDRHRRYELEGRITHSFDLCPERRNPAVVKIFDDNGISRLVSVARVQ